MKSLSLSLKDGNASSSSFSTHSKERYVLVMVTVIVIVMVNVPVIIMVNIPVIVMVMVMNNFVFFIVSLINTHAKH